MAGDPSANRYRHYCTYPNCEHRNKFYARRYRQEFENGNLQQTTVFFTTESTWDDSRIETDKNDLKLQETNDVALFCCNSDTFVASITNRGCGEQSPPKIKKITKDKCNEMIPPPCLSKPFSRAGATRTRPVLRVVDENGKIVIDLPLRLEEFLVESEKPAVENEESLVGSVVNASNLR